MEPRFLRSCFPNSNLPRPLPVVSAVPSGLGHGNSCAEDSARYSWRLIQTPYNFTL
jgi:hypothetical protein